MAPSNEGLQCACGFHIWRDLDYRVVGGVWEWRCPVTGEVLSQMPWSPPRDMPISAAVEPGERFRGSEVPGQGFARQEPPLLREVGGL